MSYQTLQNQMYELYMISSMGSLLSWDMEVNMPRGSSVGFRGDQSAYISGHYFEKFTSPQLIDMVNKLLEDQTLSELERRNVMEIKRQQDNSLKFSKSFIEREAKLTSVAHSVWAEAKSKSDFKFFEPKLNEIIDLLKEKCEILGYQGHKYNALLDLYERGSQVSELDVLFGAVKTGLKPLIEKVQAKQSQTTSYLNQSFDSDQQLKCARAILDFLKCSSDHYHLGLATHPFCLHLHPTDIRMTTRIDPENLSSVIWSTIHEMGHGLYEMGLDGQMVGMPQSESTSLGIHESQSRFWENNIGRSYEFIEAIFPILVSHFPTQFAQATPRDIFYEVNRVTPSLIRTEADELTYHYHIMIRYEIEKLLIEGSIKTSDIVVYWNDAYRQYLDIEVPNDAKGALQDIHWSMGGMGYFPTYSQGSFYAALWYDEISKKMDLAKMIMTGDFGPIQNWHNEHIHKHGKILTSNEIAVKATGQILDFKKFEQYITKKFDI